MKLTRNNLVASTHIDESAQKASANTLANRRNSMNPASGKLRRKKNRKSHDVKSSLTATAIHAAMTSSTIADMSGEPRPSSANNSKEDEELIQVKSKENDKIKSSTVE